MHGTQSIWTGQENSLFESASDIGQVIYFIGISLWQRPHHAAEDILWTFALIVSAHPYYARKFTCHVIHRASELNTQLNNNRADALL